MEFECVKGLLKLWNLPLFAAKFVIFKDKIAAQTDKKSRGKTKSREETKAPRRFWGYHSHGSQHRL